MEFSNLSSQEITNRVNRIRNLNETLAHISNSIREFKDPSKILVLSLGDRPLLFKDLQNNKELRDETIETMIRPYLIKKQEEREQMIRADIQKLVGGNAE